MRSVLHSSFLIPTNFHSGQPRKRSDSRQSGFTLLEIIVALAIVGGLLVTLIYTLNYHLGIADRHESLTIALLLARDKMEEMEKEPSNTEGDFPEPYSAFHYQTKMNDSYFPDFSEIHVRVTFGREVFELRELIGKQK